MTRRQVTIVATSALLLIMFAAMFWLSFLAMRTEQQWKKAVHDSEVEKLVSIALWRLDSYLATFLSSKASVSAAVLQEQFTNSGNLTAQNANAENQIQFQWPEPIDSGVETAQQQTEKFPVAQQQMAQSNAQQARLTQQSFEQSDQTQVAQIKRFNRDEWLGIYDNLPDSMLEPLPQAREEQGQIAMQVYQRNIANLKQQAVKGKVSQSKSQDNDLDQRQSLLSQNAVQQESNYLLNGFNLSNSSDPSTNATFGAPIAFGVAKPIWVADTLVLARRATYGSQRFIYGARLDWTQMQEELSSLIVDILPNARLERIGSGISNQSVHQLAAVPAHLVVDSPSSASATWSPLMWAVVGGWIALCVLVAGIVGIAWNSLRFAESRTSFVNSVTHELRTPLTTFKLYSDLLRRGMVTDTSRSHYLETLNVEADRLCHLIDNVLTLSRLERNSGGLHFDRITVAELWCRIAPRLRQRSAMDQMQIELQGDSLDSRATICTDPSLVEQVLFNLIDNASKYASVGSDRIIRCETIDSEAFVKLRVQDNGPGIAIGSRRLFVPFSKSSEAAAYSKPGVGLGLALSAKIAKRLGGTLRHIPTANGCLMELTLPKSH